MFSENVRKLPREDSPSDQAHGLVGETLRDSGQPSSGVPHPVLHETGKVAIEKWVVRVVFFYLMSINLACLAAILLNQSAEVRLVGVSILTSGTTICVALLRRR